jgi:hypothetical protein
MPILSLAAQFTDEGAAHDAYAGMVSSEADHLAAHALSTFRLQSTGHWYVIVLGESDDLGPFRPLVPYLRKQGRIMAISDETIDRLWATRGARGLTPS